MCHTEKFQVIKLMKQIYETKITQVTFQWVTVEVEIEYHEATLFKIIAGW